MPATRKKKRPLRYSPHLVTYIDILGFRELIEKKSPNFISRAIRQVREITVPDVQKIGQDKEHYVYFSDLIVHTVPLLSKSNQNKPGGIVFREIRYMAMVQAVLIEKGLLLRGAVTVGDIERTYGVLFGPGLISAYELERDHAEYPRIVVDDRLIEALKSNRLLRSHNYDLEIKFISDCIRLDDDGIVFIDYLGFMQIVLKYSQTDYCRLIETHKKLIEENMLKFEGDKRVLSKYLWLRKYHNAVIRAKLNRQLQKRFYIGAPDKISDVPPLTRGPMD